MRHLLRISISFFLLAAVSPSQKLYFGLLGIPVSGCTSTATATTGGIYSSSPSDNFATSWAGDNATLTLNNAVAPDCTSTVATVTENTATSTHDMRRGITTALTNGQTLSYEVYAKRTVGTRNATLYVFNLSTFASAAHIEINLGDCSTISGPTVSGVWASPTGSASAVSPGWCKIVMTHTVLADTGIFVTFQMYGSYAGDGSSQLGWWGFHVQ